MHRISRLVLIAVLAAAIMPPQGAWAEGSKCARSKLKAVDKLAGCRVAAWRRADRTGVSPATDLAECDAEFSARWQILDGGADCHTTGDAVSVHGEIASCLDDVAGRLTTAPKIIFTTLEIVAPGDNGPLGFFTYPSRGDEICERLASHNPALSGKQFVAAVCGSEPDVAGGADLGLAQRTTDSAGGYVRTDGARIANNLSDLLDGSIQVPISYDQFGHLLPDVESGDVIPVWTGCNAAGQSLGRSLQCSDSSLWSWWFSSSIYYAAVGRPDRADSGWLDTGIADSCIVGRHLYCIEQ